MLRYARARPGVARPALAPGRANRDRVTVRLAKTGRNRVKSGPLRVAIGVKSQPDLAPDSIGYRWNWRKRVVIVPILALCWFTSAELPDEHSAKRQIFRELMVEYT